MWKPHRPAKVLLGQHNQLRKKQAVAINYKELHDENAAQDKHQKRIAGSRNYTETLLISWRYQ